KIKTKRGNSRFGKSFRQIDITSIRTLFTAGKTMKCADKRRRFHINGTMQNSKETLIFILQNKRLSRFYFFLCSDHMASLFFSVKQKKNYVCTIIMDLRKNFYRY